MQLYVILVTHVREWPLFPWLRDPGWLISFYSLQTSKARPSLACLAMDWQSEWHCCHPSCWISFCWCIHNYGHAQELSRKYWTNLFLQEGSEEDSNGWIIPLPCGKWPSSSWDHIVLCTLVEQQEVTHFDRKRVSLRFYVVISWQSLSPYYILVANTSEEGAPLHFAALLPWCWLSGTQCETTVQMETKVSQAILQNVYSRVKINIRDQMSASWTWTPHPHGVN